VFAKDNDLLFVFWFFAFSFEKKGASGRGRWGPWSRKPPPQKKRGLWQMRMRHR